MSTAFTNISTVLQNPDKVSYCNELYQATRERADVANVGSVSDITDGEDSQEIVARWASMQALLSAMWDRYIDHELAPDEGYFNNKDDSDIKVYDATRWEALTGLEIDGGTNKIKFRRVPNGNSYPSDWTDYSDAQYVHGDVQDDDMRGPWIMDDIAKCNDLLWWVSNKHLYSGPGIVGRQGMSHPPAFGFSLVDCATALSNHVTAWNTKAWVSFVESRLYRAATSSTLTGTPSYQFDRGRRFQTIFGVIPPTVVVPSVAEVYFLIEKDGVSSYLDVDGLGVAENKYYYHEAIANGSSSPRVMASYFGNYNTDPCIALGCPITTTTKGALSLYTLWVWKMDFANGTKPT